MDFEALIQTIFLFLVLMVPGYHLGKWKKLPDEALPGIGSILMYIAMPALVFVKLLETDISALEPAAIGCCVLLPVAMGLCLLLLAKRVFHRSPPGQAAVSRFCAAFPNCGFWSIPLACALYPDRPEVAVYVSVFNVFNSFLLLTVGAYILSGDKRDISVQAVCGSPVLFALLLGLILSLTDIRIRLLKSAATYLSQLATPLSMLVLGAQAAKLKPRDILLCSRMYLVSGLKLLVSPLLAMAVLRFPGLSVSQSLRTAVFLATAVSTALSAPSMAAKYGQDAKYAATVTMGTTFLCVITMPLLYMLIF